MGIDVEAWSSMLSTVLPGWAEAGTDQRTASRHARMRPVNALRRIGISVVMALTVLLVTASPASAHTVSGQGATNYRSRLTVVTPPVPGRRVVVVNLGSDLRVTWTGPTTLT